MSTGRASCREPSPEVLYRDEALLATAKPPGWESVVEGTGGRCWTTHIREALGLPDATAVHRLDRDTSGLQLHALTPSAQRALEASFRHRRAEKAYLALCLGVPFNDSGTINRSLSKWQGGRQPVRVVKGGGGLQAETGYRLVASGAIHAQGLDGLEASLLLFEPHQGRTHQIRVHAAAFGRPILGDDQYGDRAANKTTKQATGLARQALHAWRIALPHPTTGAPLRLECPPPADWRAAAMAIAPDWEARLLDLAGPSPSPRPSDMEAEPEPEAGAVSDTMGEAKDDGDPSETSRPEAGA